MLVHRCCRYTLYQGLLAYFCPIGHYGQYSEVCLPCPRGAECKGSLFEPVSMEGWWLQNATLDQCPEERQARPAPYDGGCPQVRGQDVAWSVRVVLVWWRSRGDVTRDPACDAAGGAVRATSGMLG